MEMSARFISLSINIAVMGFILLSGVHASLRDSLGGFLSAERLRSAAEKIAAGNLSTLGDLPALPQGAAVSGVVREALAHGFDLLMLYAVVGVWSLSALSLVIFNTGKVRNAEECAASSGTW
ncbi:MAG TPA: hypothetical protein VLF15_07355, partial [Pseudoxanthomonas sp.]|nr:hypothetical protein [Pseudoxanthomonas sp.]